MFGEADGSYILNSIINYATVCGEDYVGGIAGEMSEDAWGVQSQVNDVSNYGQIIGSRHVGGISGWSMWNTVANLSNYGRVTGVEYVGGIFGSYARLPSYTEYTNWNNEGTIVAESYYGDLYR